MYRIGLFSKISKTTIKTLRYYDEVGLLKPAAIDNQNGYRYYTTEQLVSLHKIISLRQIGFSIEEISSILCGGDYTRILDQKKIEIQTQLAEKEDQLVRLKCFIDEKEEGCKMKYQAVIKELPECIVYSKRLTVPNYDSYFSIIPAIGQEVSQANPGLKCASPEYCFIVYLDGEYKEQDIHIEFCEAVTEFGKETEDIKFKQIKSVIAVSVMHKGPYRDLRDAYSYAYKWIEDNDYVSIDNPRESYIDGIWNKENEQDWLTELQIPVKKK